MDDAKEIGIRIKKLSKKLSNLQRLTVINLVSGMSQRQAYIEAGGTATSPGVQDSTVSRMLSRSKVRAYYDALMEKAQLDSVMTKTEALNILSEQARDDNKDPVVVRNVQGSIKQLSTMLAWDAPKKTELTGKDGGAIEVTQIKLVGG